MNQTFFTPQATDIYLDDEGRSRLQECGGKMLTIEDMPFTQFPPVLQRFKFYSSFVLAPSKEIDSVLIPYDIFEHEERTFSGTLISEIVSDMIETQFEEKKWIASAHSDQFFFVEFTKFSYEILASFESGNMIYPFFVFDATLKNCFGFDWDFEYSFLSSQTLTDSPHFRRDLLPQWDAYFDSDFPPEFARNDPDTYRHQDIYDRFLRPSVGR